MAADTLRERIAQTLPDELLEVANVARAKVDWSRDGGSTDALRARHVAADAAQRAVLVDAILPVVEQAIRDEREKSEYFLRLAAEQHERDAAALAEKDAQIDALNGSTLVADVARHNAERQLAEKDAQIAALQQKLDEWTGADGVRWKHRETPAPPQEPRS